MRNIDPEAEVRWNVEPFEVQPQRVALALRQQWPYDMTADEVLQEMHDELARARLAVMNIECLLSVWYQRHGKKQ
jgi:hypothetical protein